MKTYTLKEILESVKIPDFKVGQFFEIKQSVFPDASYPREKKNLCFEDNSFTKPLASSKKDKESYFKEKSPVADFYYNDRRGDIVEVVDVVDGKAKCINKSMKKEALEKYYKDDYIYLTPEMVIEGEARQIVRGAKNLLIEASLVFEKKKESILEKKFSEYLKDKDY